MLSHPVGEPIVCLGWAAALELWFRLSSLVGKPIGRVGRATTLVWHPSSPSSLVGMSIVRLG